MTATIVSPSPLQITVFKRQIPTPRTRNSKRSGTILCVFSRSKGCIVLVENGTITCFTHDNDAWVPFAVYSLTMQNISE